LGIQFVLVIQALGLLGAERADLSRKHSYGGRNWVIGNWAQHNVVAVIFGKDCAGTPSLAHRCRDGYLAPAGDRKTLCHDHYNLP
jgi:hypothetical protein